MFPLFSDLARVPAFSLGPVPRRGEIRGHALEDVAAGVALEDDVIFFAADHGIAADKTMVKVRPTAAKTESATDRWVTAVPKSHPKQPPINGGNK